MMKNIIFDLDGTLWDSRTTLIESWNKVLCNYNLLEKPLVEDDLTKFMGLLLPDILPTLFPNGKPEDFDKILKEIIEHECKTLSVKGGRIYEKVEHTLDELSQNHDLYIVSNCQDGYIQAFLKFSKFSHFFKDFESAGKTGKNKQENIRLVLERNQLIPSETIYVGDTQTDYNSATANDLNFVFCNYGFGELDENSQAFAEINSFDELTDITVTSPI